MYCGSWVIGTASTWCIDIVDKALTTLHMTSAARSVPWFRYPAVHVESWGVMWFDRGDKKSGGNRESSNSGLQNAFKGEGGAASDTSASLDYSNCGGWRKQKCSDLKGRAFSRAYDGFWQNFPISKEVHWGSSVSAWDVHGEEIVTVQCENWTGE